MTTNKAILITWILPYLFVYAVFGPQEVPKWSPISFSPAVYDIAFVLGVITILLMAVWSRVESWLSLKSQKTPVQSWRKYRVTNEHEK